MSIPTPRNPPSPVDVVVVGAGIVGLAHAAAAVRRGLSVTIVDRDDRAVGASVRNFGHCCITAQHGELHDIAVESRQLWIDVARQSGIWLSRAGALVAARTDAEMAVIEELAADRGTEQVQLRSARSVSHELGSERPGDFIGGAALPFDLRVDPRAAVAGIAAWLGRQPGVRILWSTAVQSIEPGVVHTSRGAIPTAHTFVCVGHDLDLIFPELAAQRGIERCALQMMLVDLPSGRQIGPAVLSGTSLLRYEAFARTGAAVNLRAEIEEHSPELIRIGANVMFTQHSSGGLIVGDSHEYGASVDAFLDESISARLLTEVADLLGTGPLTVRQRWQGIYASSTLQPVVVDHPMPGVTAVSVTSGVGMTLSFGLGERVVAATELRHSTTANAPPEKGKSCVPID